MVDQACDLSVFHFFSPLKWPQYVDQAGIIRDPPASVSSGLALKAHATIPNKNGNLGGMWILEEAMGTSCDLYWALEPVSVTQT